MTLSFLLGAENMSVKVVWDYGQCTWRILCIPYVWPICLLRISGRCRSSLRGKGALLLFHTKALCGRAVCALIQPEAQREPVVLGEATLFFVFVFAHCLHFLGLSSSCSHPGRCGTLEDLQGRGSPHCPLSPQQD